MNLREANTNRNEAGQSQLSKFSVVEFRCRTITDIVDSMAQPLEIDQGSGERRDDRHESHDEDA